MIAITMSFPFNRICMSQNLVTVNQIFSDSDSDSEENFADAQDDHRVGNTDW